MKTQPRRVCGDEQYVVDLDDADIERNNAVLRVQGERYKPAVLRIRGFAGESVGERDSEFPRRWRLATLSLQSLAAACAFGSLASRFVL